MAKCLVLGANGFIGSHLVDALVSRGHEVRAFGMFGEREIKFIASDNVEIFEGNFLNRHDLKEALRGVDYLFHFISTTTPITAEEDPLIDIDTNVRMTIELLHECVENGNLKKVIFASTGGAIYGLNSGENVDEGVLPLPISPYAIGKLTIEHYLRYFDRKHNLPSLVFRISNPYGERQSLSSKQGVIPIFLQHIAQNQPVTVLGDGNMVRDYIYVDDVANMIAASFETAKHELYNIGSGRGVSVNELVETIRKVLGKDFTIEKAENPPTFVSKIVLDTSRFEDEFNYTPRTKLHDGILRTWRYVGEHLQKK